MNKLLRSFFFRRFFSFFLLLNLTLLVSSNIFAQVKFSAVCPNKQIGKNDYLQVQYIVENASNVEEIIPPSFDNFSVISGPNQQSGMSNINGNITQFVALEYILKPNRTGNFTLGPGTAKANGKTLRSNSLSITINNSSSGNSGAPSNSSSLSPFANVFPDPIYEPRVKQFDDYILHRNENVPEKIKKNLFIKVSVNKTSCYVGEPIVASYKLYTRLKSESNLIKSPSFNGFSVSEMELPDNYTLRTEKYNGRDYSVYTLRKVQLYPLQPGTVDLDPIEVENRVTFLKAEYANEQNGDIFYDMLRDFANATTPSDAVVEQKVTLKSDPVSVVVKPLPEINRPPDFKGAVGDFTINAEVQKHKMTTDEAGNFVVSISGSGNMQMINTPLVSWTKEIESFEPKSSEDFDKTAVPLKGIKKFSFPFTVSKPGKYTLPPVTFSYFDITTHTYKTVSTKPVNIDVKKGKGIEPLIAGSLINTNKNNSASFGDKILELRWFLLIAFVAVAGLTFWLTKKLKRNNQAPVLIKTEDKHVEEVKEEVPKSPLLQAEEMLCENNATNFYPVINHCLRTYLSVKLNFPERELNKKKINELLDKYNVGVGTTIMLTSLLENIELNLYAPLAPANQMKEVYEKASEVVSLLDKQVC